MIKKRVIKADGRYLIFYAFERPVPEIYPDQAKEAGETEGAADPRGGGPGAAARPGKDPGSAGAIGGARTDAGGGEQPGAPAGPQR